MHSTLPDLLRTNPFVGIARGLPATQASACARMCITTGLSCIEVPLNTPAADQALSALAQECLNLNIMVGAGTVRTSADLGTALAAGAQFIVSPNTNADVIQECVARNIPCFPGALTPTEIETAFRLGATAVKVFPVGALGGVSYIKELRGPFRDIPLLACGGVSTANAAAYLEAGCDLLAFGGSIFAPQAMQQGQWDLIGEKVAQLLRAAGFHQ